MPERLTIVQIFTLCAASGSIDLLFAVQGAYFVPAIYDSGVSREYGPLLLICSPVLVILFQNCLGSASDGCSCKWGRRKPFILGLCITAMLGLLLFPVSWDLASLANRDTTRDLVVIVIIIASTILIDLGITSEQVPLRAYLLDVLPQKQLVIGNIISPLFSMLGATAAFGIGSINWPSIFSLSNKLSTQVKFVCGLSILITIVLTVITLCSVKEQPPHQRKDVVTSSVELAEVLEPTNHSPTSGNNSSSVYQEVGSLQEFLKRYLSYDNITMLPYGGTAKQQSSCIACEAIVGNVRFIRCISLSTALLYVAIFFSLLVWYCQNNFFTHYVGEVVYNGDVFAPENSTAYKNYTEGVKIGSLILAVSSLSGFVILLLVGPAIKLFGLRPLFVLPYVLLMLQSGILTVSHNLVVVIILSPAISIMIMQFLLFPNILISMYEAEGLLLRKSWPYSDTNLIGRCFSLLIVAVELGKIVALSANGPLMSAYGSAVSVMIFTCICSFLGAIVACFVTVPSTVIKKKPTTIRKPVTTIAKPKCHLDESSV